MNKGVMLSLGDNKMMVLRILTVELEPTQHIQIDQESIPLLI